MIPFNTLKTLPRLKDLLNTLKRDIFLSLNCHALATVQSFDSANQTIKATIDYSRVVTDSSGVQTPIQYPIVADVPVISLCGGSTFLTFPITVGDKCLLLFNDRDLDNWFQGVYSGPPNSARLHSFSDAVALVGLNDVASYDSTRAVLSNGTTMVGINPQTDKVTLTNGTSLKTLLQTLITDLQSLVTQISLITVTCATPGNPSSPPVNAAAITAISTQLSSDSTAIGGLLE